MTKEDDREVVRRVELRKLSKLRRRNLKFLFFYLMIGLGLALGVFTITGLMIDNPVYVVWSTIAATALFCGCVALFALLTTFIHWGYVIAYSLLAVYLLIRLVLYIFK